MCSHQFDGFEVGHLRLKFERGARLRHRAFVLGGDRLGETERSDALVAARLALPSKSVFKLKKVVTLQLRRIAARRLERALTG